MNRKILSNVQLLGLILLFAAAAYAYPTRYTAALNSMQIVPAKVSSAGRGACIVDINKTEQGDIWLNVACNFYDMTSAVTDATVRLGSAGENGKSAFEYKEIRIDPPDSSTGTVFIKCIMNNSPTFAPWNDQYLFLEKKLHIVLSTANNPDGEIRGQIKPVTFDSDVDGEGRAEMSVFRPKEAMTYSFCSMLNMSMAKQLEWQFDTDTTPFLIDFDRDGISEWTYVRTDPETSALSTIYRRNTDNELVRVPWGNALLGDVPVYGDYDGDGNVDISVFRSTTGVWYIKPLAPKPDAYYVYWGLPGDRPCPADYDGDGITDFCTVRDENGQLAWNILRSSDGIHQRTLWGLPKDEVYTATPVDVDADGANDLLVSRGENNQRVFYALRSSDNSWFILPWGLATDAVKLGDYDADGKTDFASIREIDNQLIWYINHSHDGYIHIAYWGILGDK